MTDPADLAAADQYLAAQRAATIQDIAAVLAAVRGRTTRETATAVYDAAIGPMLALVDASMLAIHEALASYPDALAAVQQAISALPRPEETR